VTDVLLALLLRLNSNMANSVIRVRYFHHLFLYSYAKDFKLNDYWVVSVASVTCLPCHYGQQKELHADAEIARKINMNVVTW
jgi:hypothetical protein